jgi:predicted phosphodiesterase
MQVAVVSDIHGNLTAFEAVLADLRQCLPDLVLHGGDLADPGSRSLGTLIGLSFAASLGNRDS